MVVQIPHNPCVSQGDHFCIYVNPAGSGVLLNEDCCDGPSVPILTVFFEQNLVSSNQFDEAVPGNITPMLVVFRAVNRVQSYPEFSPKRRYDYGVAINYVLNPGWPIGSVLTNAGGSVITLRIPRGGY